MSVVTTNTKKDKSGAVIIRPKNILRCDLKEYEYKYFKDIIESQVTEMMISDKRLKLISKIKTLFWLRKPNLSMIKLSSLVLETIQCR